MSASETLIF